MATAKTQYITIPLNEYKELILKDKPTDKDHEICERIFSVITSHIEYTDNKWDSYFIGDNMKVDGPTDIVEEIMRIIKYIDFERYMKIWNGVQTVKRNKKAMQAQMDQMNAAKDLRNEHNE